MPPVPLLSSILSLQLSLSLTLHYCCHSHSPLGCSSLPTPPPTVTPPPLPSPFPLAPSPPISMQPDGSVTSEASALARWGIVPNQSASWELDGGQVRCRWTYSISFFIYFREGKMKTDLSFLYTHSPRYHSESDGLCRSNKIIPGVRLTVSLYFMQHLRESLKMLLSCLLSPLT